MPHHTVHPTPHRTVPPAPRAAVHAVPAAHPRAVLPGPPATVHATTAPPKIIVDSAVQVPTGSPEATFVFVAITLPALIAAGAGFVSHAIGRHR